MKETFRKLLETGDMKSKQSQWVMSFLYRKLPQSFSGFLLPPLRGGKLETLETGNHILEVENG